MIKLCKTCNTEKDVELFGFKSHGPNGAKYQHYMCKPCCAQKSRERSAKKNQRNRLKREENKPKPKEGHKFCTKCEIEKGATVEFFYSNKAAKDGLQSWCKSCFSQFKVPEKIERVFKWAEKEGHKICRRCEVELPLDLFRVHKRKGRTAIRESYCTPCEADRDRERRERDPEKAKATGLRHRILHRDRINARNREKYHQDPEKSKEASRRKTKAPGYREKINEWRRKKQKEDPIFRLSCVIRNRTFKAMRDRKFSKNLSLFEYLGCTAAELQDYVESLWKPDMTWENWGKESDRWVLDHDIPLSSAKTEEDVYRLSHFSNMKPMWSYLNMLKGDMSAAEWASYKLQHGIDESQPPLAASQPNDIRLS